MVGPVDLGHTGRLNTVGSLIGAVANVGVMTTHGELTADQLERLGKEFAVDPKNRLLQNALTRNEVDEIAMDRALSVSAERSMSHRLDDWVATNQKQSGRCWLFAGLNLLRVGAAQKMDLAEFEFSQNHLLFWDKLEKANFWLEGVIATSDRDADDRTVAHLMSDPIGDGGQWNMFVALVRKHGLVPKSRMPETVASSSTRQLNRDLKVVLRQAARDLRDRAAAGESVDDLRDRKEDTLRSVHRMLSLHLARRRNRSRGSGRTRTRASTATTRSLRRSSPSATSTSTWTPMSVWSTTLDPPAPVTTSSPSSISATS